MEDEVRKGLNGKATITASGETGEIIGISVFLHSETCYLLRYKAADGRAVEAWWNASALTRHEEG